MRVTGQWERLASRLDRLTSRLEACAPDDLARLAEVLAERQQPVEELLPLAREHAAEVSPATLDRLSAASRAGRDFAIRLRLQTEALRRQFAAETARGRLLLSLSAPEPPGSRINVRS